MKRLKYTALIIVAAMACYGSTKLRLQSPVVEREVIQQETLRQPVALPRFQLTQNIDAQEFWAARAGE